MRTPAERNHGSSNLSPSTFILFTNVTLGSADMTQDYELIIIGAGPAGLAAGIYAGRYGMQNVILESGIPGGQIKTTPFIENYLGVGKLTGMELTDKMKAHAEEFTQIKEFYEVTAMDPIKDDPDDYRFFVKTTMGDFRTKGILIGTGVSHRTLEVPGEAEYLGRGVSYCATCDGFFFKEKKIAVVGGGATAVTEAVYLASIGCDTTVIHRRDQLRAEEALITMAKKEGVKFILDTVVTEVKGDGQLMKSIALENKKTGESSEFQLDGIFIAIGDVPNNALSKAFGVEHDDWGYIKTDRQMRTNVERVYAAGDIIGGIRQVQTAAGEGVVAVTTAYKEIKNPYWS